MAPVSDIIVPIMTTLAGSVQGKSGQEGLSPLVDGIADSFFDSATEQHLQLIFTYHLKSPSLDWEVRRLVESGMLKDDIVKQLEGQDDPQREVTEEFPAQFTRTDILSCWIYAKTLERLKLISLAKQSIDEHGLVPVFHGTTSDRKQEIMSSGLLPDCEDTGFSRGFRPSKKGFVFLYINSANAYEHAMYMARLRHSKAIFVWGKVSPSLLVPDLGNSSPHDSYKIASVNLPMLKRNNEFILDLY